MIGAIAAVAVICFIAVVIETLALSFVLGRAYIHKRNAEEFNEKLDKARKVLSQRDDQLRKLVRENDDQEAEIRKLQRELGYGSRSRRSQNLRVIEEETGEENDVVDTTGTIVL